MTHLDKPGALDGGPEHWGPNIWGELHEVVSKIPCGTCRPFGERAIRAVHDIVNAKLGKSIRYPSGLCQFTREASGALAKCHRTGECSGSMASCRK